MKLKTDAAPPVHSAAASGEVAAAASDSGASQKHDPSPVSVSVVMLAAMFVSMLH